MRKANLDHSIFRIPISWIEHMDNAFHLHLGNFNQPFDFKVMPSQCLLTMQLHWSFKFHDTCFISRAHISTHNKYRQLCFIWTEVDPKFLSGLGKNRIVRIGIICIGRDRDFPICPV